MTVLHLCLFYTLIALMIADASTTIYILRKGIGREGNPIVAKLIEKLGRDRVLVGWRIVAIAALIYTRSDQPAWALAVVAGLYAYTVINNLRIIQRAKK